MNWLAITTVGIAAGIIGFLIGLSMAGRADDTLVEDLLAQVEDMERLALVNDNQRRDQAAHLAHARQQVRRLTPVAFVPGDPTYN